MRLLVALFALIPALSFGATYTVTNGTSTIDGDTFCSGTCTGGDIIEFQGGAYTLTGTSLTIRDFIGSSGNPIIFRLASTATGPVVVKRNADRSGFLVHLYENRYIEFDFNQGWVGSGGAYCGAPAGRTGCGFQLEAYSLTDNPTSFFKLGGVNNLRDITIKGVEVDCSTKSFSGVGIGIHMADGAATRGVDPTRENFVISNNYVHGCYGEGIYFGSNPYAGQPNNGNNEISYNLIEDTGRDGIEMKSNFDGTGTTIGNYLYNVGKRSDQAGQQNGVTVGGYAKHIGNYVENAGEVAIRCIAYNSYQPGGVPWNFTCEAYNNITVNAGVTGPNAGYGIAASANQGDTVAVTAYNNTVVDSEAAGINTSFNAGAATIRNNIVVGDTTADNINCWAGGCTIEDNLQGTVASAGFVNATAKDFSLTSGSSAVDIVGLANYPATDHVGTSRPQGTYADQGAYEYIADGGGGDPDPGDPLPGITTAKPTPCCTADNLETYFPDWLYMVAEGSGTTVDDIGGAADAYDLTITGADWETDTFWNSAPLLSCVASNSDHATYDNTTAMGLTGTITFGFIGKFDTATSFHFPMSLQDADAAKSFFDIKYATGSGITVEANDGDSADQNNTNGDVNDGNYHLILARASDTSIDVSIDGAGWDTMTISRTGLMAKIDSISLCRRGASSPSGYFDGDIYAAFVWKSSISDPSTIWNSGDPWSALGIDLSGGGGSVPVQRGAFAAGDLSRGIGITQ